MKCEYLHHTQHKICFVYCNSLNTFTTYVASALTLKSSFLYPESEWTDILRFREKGFLFKKQ